MVCLTVALAPYNQQQSSFVVQTSEADIPLPSTTSFVDSNDIPPEQVRLILRAGGQC
jgi:hypothetical protein